MKKTLLLASAVLLIGAGCSQAPEQTTNTERYEESALPVNDMQEDTVEVTELTIEEPGTPSVSPDEVPQDLPIEKNTMSYATLDGQKDLAAEFNTAIFHTSMGDITVELYSDASPKTVNNFLNLAEAGEYNGTKFHRVIQDFMIQGGDPLSKDDAKKSFWGTGGPDYRFEDEFNDKPLVKGSLAMANAGPNTNGSQFFIVTAPETAWLDGKHTNFGQVTAGMDVVDAIGVVQTAPGDKPLENIVVESVELVK